MPWTCLDPPLHMDTEVADVSACRAPTAIPVRIQQHVAVPRARPRLRAATDVFWPFTYEQMETRGRAAVLGEALKALGLPQAHSFVNADARLVNRSDAYCDRVMEILGK